MELLGAKKKWWVGLSLALVVIGAISLSLWDLRIGLDFTGGTLFEVASSNGQKIDRVLVENNLKDIGVPNVITQTTGENSLQIKSSFIDQEKHLLVSQILSELKLTELRFENVGPTVGADLTRKAILAVAVASLAIILYIAYSFRNVPKPASSWRFGVTAVIALIHDVFITIGVFALLGHWLGYEVDALFITALLTVMGFSVHDTIVVFDRLRENMRHSSISTTEQFEAVADASLVQTLNRSLNTSLTVILVLLAMALLGGETIRPFIVALLIGITVGTYSSMFTATPLLVIWQGLAMKRGEASK